MKWTKEDTKFAVTILVIGLTTFIMGYIAGIVHSWSWR